MWIGPTTAVWPQQGVGLNVTLRRDRCARDNRSPGTLRTHPVRSVLRSTTHGRAHSCPLVRAAIHAHRLAEHFIWLRCVVDINPGLVRTEATSAAAARTHQVATRAHSQLRGTHMRLNAPAAAQRGFRAQRPSMEHVSNMLSAFCARIDHIERFGSRVLAAPHSATRPCALAVRT